MRKLGLRYVHFLLALSVALVAAFFGAFPGLFVLGMPGTEDDRITMDLVWLGLTPGTGAAVLAFWLVGRWPPLGASLLRTIIAGFVAAQAFAFLVRLAARTAWLTLDMVTLLAFLVALATLGFGAFAWPTSNARTVSPREGAMEGRA